MSIISMILVVIVAFLAGIEGVVDEFQFHQPLVACTLIGLVTGNLEAGIVLGGSLQMIALGWANIGAAVAPDAALASVASAIILVLGGQGVKGVSTAIAVAIPLAVAGLFLTMVVRTLSVACVHRMDAEAEKVNFRGVEMWHIIAICLQGLRIAIPAACLLAIPTETVQNFLQSMPAWLTDGMSIGGGMVVAVGYAMVINMIATKEVWPFFAIGFCLAAISDLTLIALGAIALAIAFIYINLSEKGGNGNGGGGNVGDPLDDILNDYWSQTLSKKERLFYYPLYLWWQITAILPLRPREFLLIQRNCLTEKDGKYFLTLRRNIIKGRDRLVAHKISEDYTLNTYEITNSLASEIKTYLKLTENDRSTKLDTLFVTDPHYNRWGRRTGVNNRFLTYTNLNTILRYFFNEIISQKYGYQVNYFSFPARLDENEINLIHIGDTRHIAMINLIAEGASPVTAMLLAGHEDVTTSSHYFSNLSQFIECRSYQMYRKLTSKNTNYTISKRQPFYTAQGQYITLENKGRCYSPRFAKGDYSDCLKVISEHAELGACTSCPFYRKAGKDYFSMDKTFKKSVDEKAMVVDEAIRKVRQGKGHIEDIGEALLKLKTVSNTYQDYLNAKQLSLEENKSNG